MRRQDGSCKWRLPHDPECDTLQMWESPHNNSIKHVILNRHSCETVTWQILIVEWDVYLLKKCAGHWRKSLLFWVRAMINY